MKIKKIITTLFMVSALLMVVTPISAEEQNNEETYFSAEYIEMMNDFMIQKNQGIELHYTSYSLGITRLAQNDSRWANTKLGNCDTSTIGSHGCALTAVTMVYNYYKNTSLTPADINSKLSNICSMNWYSAASIMGKSVLATNATLNSSNVYTVVEANLSNSYPVIIKLVKSGSTHFVVAYGYYESGSSKTIYVRDPGGNNYATLQDCLNGGWSLSQYYVIG